MRMCENTNNNWKQSRKKGGSQIISSPINFTDLLQCPVCALFMYPPIFQSWNGGEMSHQAAGQWGGQVGSQWENGGYDSVKQSWDGSQMSPVQSAQSGAQVGSQWENGGAYGTAKQSWNGGEMNPAVAGPWGGQGGSQWDDGIYSAVKHVVITSAAGIDSIQIEYDKNGFSVWSDRHGGTSGIKTDKVKIEYPNEFLVSISGHYGPVAEGGPVIVRSLRLQSNKANYGPFGYEQGVPFSLPINGGKIVGFYGRSSWYLDSIGVYVKTPMQKHLSERQNVLPGQIIPSLGVISAPKIDAVIPSSKRIRSCGPWGGSGGMAFNDGIYGGVREIHITRSGGLVSIQVCYDQNSRVVWGNKNGGLAGLKFDKIVFDYPFEVLTSISGYYGSTILRGPTIVKSITFHTTKRTYGPFGDQQGFSFSSGSNGIIVGFHGKRGYFVNSIGVHVLESQPLLRHPYPDPFELSPLNTREVVWGVPREAAGCEGGPWGGDGGNPWDDGVYRGVKKIILTRGEAICSIKVEYDRNGQSVWGSQHGTPYEACTYAIKFDYPYEVLTSISGYYDTLYGDRNKKVVRSLTFHTNRAKYGPYGKEIGMHFTSARMEGWIIGFHGRSGSFLDAIGVHMQYWLCDGSSQHPYPSQKGVVKTLLDNILPL